MIKEVKVLRKISKKKATSLIQNYIKNNPGCRTSDIIYDLEIDPDIVLEILHELETNNLIQGEEYEMV